MLKRLRIQFVAVVMVIVTIMLCTVFGMLYFFTRSSLEQESLAMMRAVPVGMLAPGQPLAPFARPDERPEQVRLPFFVVQEEGDGTLKAAGVGYYALSPGEAFDQAFLQELMGEVDRAERPFGELKQYHLRFLRADGPFGQSVIFADTTSEQSTLNNLAKNCILIGVLCFFAFLAISLKLAAWTVKPVGRAWQQQRQFVSDASHELKTPLTVIMTNAELLQSGENDRDGQAQFSANILTMSRQMRALVEQMLELARADSNQRQLALEPVDLSTLTADALLPFEPVFFEQGLELFSQIEDGITVHGDAGRLKEVLEILLDNARKYTQPPGTVRVRLERRGHHRCRLTVSNPGPPLSETEQKDIFKRFYRADPARSRDGSFGLGLSIAQRITEEHHGHIWAESGDGDNRFIVELPIR